MPGNDMTRFVVPLKGLNYFPGSKFTASTRMETVERFRTVTIGSATVTRFRFRGYYPPDDAYEIWFGSSRTEPPPSGHTLETITIEAMSLPAVT